MSTEKTDRPLADDLHAAALRAAINDTREDIQKLVDELLDITGATALTLNVSHLPVHPRRYVHTVELSLRF